MGTNYTISIINQTNKRVDTQLLQNQVDSLLIEVNNIFSHYIDSSEISSINRHLSTRAITISPEIAEVIGKSIAKRSIEKGIKSVSFDKGKYKYHGIIKILADSARSAGLDF